MSKVTGTSTELGISLTDPGHLVSLGLGAGLVSKAPGTWGSLLALPLFLVMQPHGEAAYLALVAGLFLAGIYLSGRTARALGVHDHNAIVIDEIVGMLVTWIAVDPGWFAVIAGFVLFRFFDILKPWPVSRVDRSVTGGLGIMLDDLVAGAMAAAALQVLLLFVQA